MQMKRLLFGLILLLIGGCKNTSGINIQKITNPITDTTTYSAIFTLNSKPTIQSIYDKSDGRYSLKLDIRCLDNNDFIDVKFRNYNMFKEITKINSRFDKEKIVRYKISPREYYENISGVENFVLIENLKSGKRQRSFLNKKFLEKMTQHNKLFIEFKPYNLGWQIAEFDLLDKEKDIKKIYEICINPFGTNKK